MEQSEIDNLIRMAWEDRTSFEEIYEQTRLTEADVIKLMRSQLKSSSFRMWRKRVSGRLTKHRKLFKYSRSKASKTNQNYKRYSEEPL